MMDANLADVASRSSVIEAEDSRPHLSPLQRFLSRISRRKRVAASLIMVDVLVAAGALLVADFIATTLGEASVLAVGFAVPLALVVSLHMIFGLYNGLGPGPFERFRLRGMAAAFVLAASIIMALGGSAPLVHVIAGTIASAFLLVAGFYGGAIARHFLLRAKIWGAPSIIVGGARDAARLKSYLRSNPQMGLRPVGTIAVGPRDGDDAAIPGIENFVVAARKAEVALFFSAAALRRASALVDDHAGIRLMLVSDAADMQAMWPRPRSLGDVVATEIHRDLFARHNQAFKRLFDIILTLPLAIFALPLVGVLALLIKYFDPGPALFVHERIGRGGRAFKVFKLRSMFTDAEARLERHLKEDAAAQEEWQRHFKLRDDPRILPVIGNFIRRTSLDELPQLWNILRGDMSLVGPRPFPAYHVAMFDADFRRFRAKVTPGLTGLWQVSSRSDGDIDTQRSEDLYYIRNWSVWFDLYILLQTLPAVIFGRGAR